MRCLTNGEKINTDYVAFRKAVKDSRNASELLFEKLPRIFKAQLTKPSELCLAIQHAKSFFDHAVIALQADVTQCLRDVFQHGQPKRASLKSIMLDFCDSLPLAVFEEIFADGTSKFLELCRTDGINDNELLHSIVRYATGLRLTDWSDQTFVDFQNKIKQYKETACGFEVEDSQESVATEEPHSDYEFTFLNAQGKAAKKRFAKIDYSPRAKLLRNSLLANIEAMGQSISEQEKRQVIAEILQEFC